MSSSNWYLTRRLESALGALAVAAHRRPVRACMAVVLLAGALVGVGGKLPLTADLADLLPESFQSVRDLEMVKERFGGIGYVVVVGQSAKPAALRRFAEELVPKLEALPSVRYVEYKRPVAFFEDRIFYFVETSDLGTIEERISARIEWERNNANPLYLDLEESEPPDVEFSDLRKKYAGRSDQTWMQRQIGEPYYLDPDKRIIALLAKPSSASFDLAFSKQVVDDVKRTVATLDPESYGPEFTVGYTGRYTRKVDQHELINRDLQVASLAAIILMLAYLAIHFRRVLAILFIIAPLVVGLIWTYGFAGIAFGALNILTGFIGAILLGLGVDHGIHLLARYTAERERGHGSEAAVRAAFGSTGRAVIIAALTTAVGFAGLGASEFRAFREFGIIAGAGMILVVLAYVTCMPALLSLAAQRGWKPHRRVRPRPSEHAARLPRRGRRIFLVSALLLLGIATQVPRARFDYNFSALEAHDLPSFVLDKPVQLLLGYSQSPVVILTSTLEEERAIAGALRRRQEEQGEHSTVDFVVATADLIPMDQVEKQPILARLHEAAMKISPRQVSRDYRKHLRTVRRMTATPPFGRDDLPPEVSRQFKGVYESGDYGFVLVFPGIELTVGSEVSRFAEEVRGVPLADGRSVSAAGEDMILADIFDMVTREAPPVLTLTLVLIFVTLVFLLGSLRQALLCLAPGLGTLAVTLGLLPLAGVDLNYLNIVMIPVLFGIAVDGGAHLVTRLAAGQDLTEAMGETGRAIAGAILTTGLGFSTLALADHPGLNSLGNLAILGLAANALITLVALPAFLAWRPLK